MVLLAQPRYGRNEVDKFKVNSYLSVPYSKTDLIAKL